MTLWSLRDPRTLAFLAAAGAALLLFLRQERRAPEPMLPLDLAMAGLAALLVAVALTFPAGSARSLAHPP